jgi:hypothetical protein
MLNLGNLLADRVDPPGLDQARSWYQKGRDPLGYDGTL